jgi:hypothetical protein
MSLGFWTPPVEANLLDATNRVRVERYILKLLDEQVVAATAEQEPAFDVESELRIPALRAAFIEVQQAAHRK